MIHVLVQNMSTDKHINIHFTLPDSGFVHFLFFNRLAVALVNGEGVIVYFGYSPNNNDPKKWFAFYFSKLALKEFQESSKTYFSEVGLPKDTAPLPTAPEYLDCAVHIADNILLSRLEGNCQISLYAFSYHSVVSKIRAKKQTTAKDAEPVSLCPIAVLRSPDEEHKRLISFLMGVQP